MCAMVSDPVRLAQAARALDRTVEGLCRASLAQDAPLAAALRREALAVVGAVAEAQAATSLSAARRAFETARSALLALLGLVHLGHEEGHWPAAAQVDLVEQTRRLLDQIAGLLEDEQALKAWLAAANEALSQRGDPATLPDVQQLPVALEALQPNSRHCFVCGLENPCGLQMRFFQTGPGEVTAYYRAPACFEGYPGVVHGGIQAAMMDEALGRAVMGTDPETARLFYTAKMTITYRRHVPTGETLRIVGRVIKDRGRALRSWAGIHLDATGELLTEAEGLLMAVPEEEFREMDPEALGWRVYPMEELGS